MLQVSLLQSCQLWCCCSMGFSKSVCIQQSLAILRMRLVQVFHDYQSTSQGSCLDHIAHTALTSESVLTGAYPRTLPRFRLVPSVAVPAKRTAEVGKLVLSRKDHLATIDARICAIVVNL